MITIHRYKRFPAIKMISLVYSLEDKRSRLLEITDHGLEYSELTTKQANALLEWAKPFFENFAILDLTKLEGILSTN